MKRVDKEPTSGTFAVIWEYNGTPWVDTIMIDDDGFHVFNHVTDEYDISDRRLQAYPNFDAIFYIAD